MVRGNTLGQMVINTSVITLKENYMEQVFSIGLMVTNTLEIGKIINERGLEN